MKKLIIILVTLMVFLGCEKKYEMDLGLKNSTENNISVELFPNRKYQCNNDMYRISDMGEGCNYTKFTMYANSRENIFMSKNVNQQPCELITNVFDSIHISINNESRHIIKFSKDTVIGYSNNIFTENSIWNYQIMGNPRPTQGIGAAVEAHLVTFEILVDKLIK